MGGPFSGLRLYWGDEFNAEKGEDGTLRLTSICMPRPYVHFRFLTSGGFNNEHQLARHLHSLGGGWEERSGTMTQAGASKAFTHSSAASASARLL